MNGEEILDRSLKRYKFTRRYSGRRAITPMRSKVKKIQKTRGHKVEKKHVPLCKQTSSHDHEKRSETSHEDKHGEHQEWKGKQNGDSEGGKENQEEQTQVEQKGNPTDSTKQIHPGPIQTMLLMSASQYDTQEEKIEAEQLL